MVDDASNIAEVAKIDDIKVHRLMKNIVKLEEVNSKTHELVDSAMVRKIAKMIEEEADCY